MFAQHAGGSLDGAAGPRRAPPADADPEASDADGRPLVQDSRPGGAVRWVLDQVGVSLGEDVPTGQSDSQHTWERLRAGSGVEMQAAPSCTSPRERYSDGEASAILPAPAWPPTYDSSQP